MPSTKFLTGQTMEHSGPTATGDASIYVWFKVNSYANAFVQALCWRDGGGSNVIGLDTEEVATNTLDAFTSGIGGGSPQSLATGAYTGWMLAVISHVAGANEFKVRLRKDADAALTTLTVSVVNSALSNLTTVVLSSTAFGDPSDTDYAQVLVYAGAVLTDTEILDQSYTSTILRTSNLVGAPDLQNPAAPNVDLSPALSNWTLTGTPTSDASVPTSWASAAAAAFNRTPRLAPKPGTLNRRLPPFWPPSELPRSRQLNVSTPGVMQGSASMSLSTAGALTLTLITTGQDRPNPVVPGELNRRLPPFWPPSELPRSRQLLASVAQMVGSASMSLSTSGLLVGAGALAGTASPALACAGAIAGAGALAGTCTPALTPAGALAGGGALVGSSALALTPAGALGGDGACSGTSSPALSTSGAAAGTGALAGTAACVLATTGNLADAAAGSMQGSASMSLATAGSIAGAGAMAASAAPALATAGAIGAVGSMGATASCVLSTTGTLTNGTGAMQGSSTIALSTSGLLTAAGTLAGSCTPALSPSATLAGAGAMSATASCSLSTSGTLGTDDAMIASAAMALVTAGVLGGAGGLSGSSLLSLAAAGAMGGAGAMQGTASMSLSASLGTDAARPNYPPIPLRSSGRWGPIKVR